VALKTLSFSPLNKYLKGYGRQEHWMDKILQLRAQEKCSIKKEFVIIE